MRVWILKRSVKSVKGVKAETGNRNAMKMKQNNKQERKGGISVKHKQIVALAVLVMMLSFTAVYSQKTKVDVSVTVEQTSTGTINWEYGAVKAKGTGAPPSNMPPGQSKLMARRAAVADCYRNLAETIYGVRVDSETTVKNFVTESDVIKTQVSGLVQGAQIGAEKEMGDGTYEVECKIGMYGAKESVSSVIIEQAVQDQKKVYEEKNIPLPEPLPEPPMPEQIPASAYTGLVLDCRGLGVKPAMSPKVVSESGEDVYGTLKVDPDVIIEKGLVGYTTSIEKAKKNPRAGNNPLVIKATGKQGNFSADVVVSSSDAGAIYDANAKAGFLQNLNVMVVN